LRLRKKSQANQPKGKALSTLELNVESKGDSTGIYGMLKGAMQDMITQVFSAIQAAVPGNFSTVGSVATLSMSDSSELSSGCSE
jgi:hypothetical protein